MTDIGGSIFSNEDGTEGVSFGVTTLYSDGVVTDSCRSCPDSESSLNSESVGE